MKLGRISGAAIVCMLSFSLLPGACAPGPSSQKSDVEEDTTCRVPRVMFVLDASASMLESIQSNTSSMTKWQALSQAVHAVLGEHGNGAQYGLMTFPGKESACSTGEVLVDIGLRTRETIDSEIQRLVIPDDAATPAGQTLIAASTHESLIDRRYDNYVIFISDGWQYCSVPTSGAPECGLPGDCEWMGAENCETCNACQTGDTSAECYGANADGCYCVRNWPVAGVDALKAAGVKTYVVGFGDKVDAYTLNQAAVAGGNPLPNCNANSETPSCFLQATSPAQLTDVLGKVMMRLTTEPCTGTCGAKGTRTCTLEGWTKCNAKCTQSTSSTGSGSSTSSGSGAGGEEGTSTSTSTSTSTGTSTSTTSTSSGYGGSENEGGASEGGSSGQGGSSGEGAGDSTAGEDDPWDDGGEDYDDEDVYEDEPSSSSPTEPEAEAEGGCSYGPSSNDPSNTALGLALLGLIGVWRRRRPNPPSPN